MIYPCRLEDRLGEYVGEGIALCGLDAPDDGSVVLRRVGPLVAPYEGIVVALVAPSEGIVVAIPEGTLDHCVMELVKLGHTIRLARLAPAADA